MKNGAILRGYGKKSDYDFACFDPLRYEYTHSFENNIGCRLYNKYI